MGKFLRISNGIGRSFDEAATASVPIYDETIVIVASSPSAGESLPINSGTPITLPGSETYDGEELQIFFNGTYLEDVIDYVATSSTQVTLTFDLVVGDKLRFRKDRPAE